MIEFVERNDLQPLLESPILMPEYVSATIEHIRTELRKIIVGQEDPIEQILVAILAEGHALIEGVPGTAKTLTVKTLARIINAGFGRVGILALLKLRSVLAVLLLTVEDVGLV